MLGDILYAFISDTHLSDNNEEKVELFIATIQLFARKQGTVYLLGDLFDFWAGDDDLINPQVKVVNTLKRAVQDGAKIFLITGNRDFLIGKKFFRTTGVQVLPELSTVKIEGEKILLTHGDLLCTKDISYQVFRRIIRNPIIKWMFLSLPLVMRKALVNQTKKQTKKSVTKKPTDVMDVEQKTVIDLMLKYDVTNIIHGHTHLPGIHTFEQDGKSFSRTVLGDWEMTNIILVISNKQKQLIEVQNLLGE